MRELKRFLGLSILCWALSAPGAHAADFGSLKDDPIVHPPTWTGFFFGGGAGFSRNESDNNYRDTTGLTSSVKETSDGGFVSAIVGFDRQIRDRFVVGIFADFDLSDITRTVRGAGFRDQVTLDWSWALGGRLGYLIHDDFLVYVTGGYTRAHFDNDGFWDIRNAFAPGGILPGRNDLTFGGYFVGGGIERRLHNNFYLRGEFRYSDYDGEIINSGRFAGVDYVDEEVPSVFSGRVALTYKIGHGPGSRHRDHWSDDGYEAHSYKVISFSGVDVAKDALFFYSGNYFALNGDFDKDGPLFRAFGIIGDYEYDSGGTPNVVHEAKDRLADVMFGYQIVGDKVSALGFIGYEVRDIDLKPDDPTNLLRGTKSGFKVATDIETHEDVPLFVGISASYSTAFDAYEAQLRLGYNMKKTVLGVEGEVFGDEEDDAQRIGAFATLRFNITPSIPAELTVNGGYQFVDSTTPVGLPPGVTASSTRGGEGGYFGSNLGFAF